MVNLVQEPLQVPPSHRERLGIANQSGREMTEFEHGDGALKTRLWDTIDGSWTTPLPTEMVQVYYLRKLVELCTIDGCKYTSVYPGGVASHIRVQIEQAEFHKEASLTSMLTAEGIVMKTCSGCEQSFKGRKHQGEIHLKQMTEAAPLHSHATTVIVNRFALGPPSEPASPNGHAGPVELQVERRQPALSRRRRSRHRGRKR